MQGGDCVPSGSLRGQLAALFPSLCTLKSASSVIIPIVCPTGNERYFDKNSYRLLQPSIVVGCVISICEFRLE